ncbi:purine nucleoside phosphorylase [Blastocystis sp. subtype 4]|uniref:purine nucleoside phosphorylase n=1 Tax=Blastocystis sp. subtype 4 TaxID=944170 RepID=UPI000711EF83|nr:purine nucleoside phosphorylase [Blastocystis sp. subtype 4]KNB46022.1 purine nucleoside phosphorylase [Blastocystis sp. subtype 4]|eukprot:XP_014529464.1 purine nucleoside phosphorylase [Blastocystis sp. subtype 4]
MPLVGVVCGSGLGTLADALENRVDLTEQCHEVLFDDRSNLGDGDDSFPVYYGTIRDVPCIILGKRYHFYQGYTPQQTALPIVLMKALGVELVILSNAAGGLNNNYHVGDLMIIKDHISLLGMSGNNPLIGRNNEDMGTRFPSLCNAYDIDLRELFCQVATDMKKSELIQQGVYVCQSGPCYETPAECNFLRLIGGDAAGMSTVNEVVACRHLGMRVFAVSLITNISVMPGVTDYIPPSHQEVNILLYIL